MLNSLPIDLDYKPRLCRVVADDPVHPQVVATASVILVVTPDAQRQPINQHNAKTFYVRSTAAPLRD